MDRWPFFVEEDDVEEEVRGLRRGFRAPWAIFCKVVVGVFLVRVVECGRWGVGGEVETRLGLFWD